MARDQVPTLVHSEFRGVFTCVIVENRIKGTGAVILYNVPPGWLKGDPRNVIELCQLYHHYLQLRICRIEEFKFWQKGCDGLQETKFSTLLNTDH